MGISKKFLWKNKDDNNALCMYVEAVFFLPVTFFFLPLTFWFRNLSLVIGCVTGMFFGKCHGYTNFATGIIFEIGHGVVKNVTCYFLKIWRK